MTTFVDLDHCPINADALCVCGVYADKHHAADHPIEPAPGEDLACPDRQPCTVCDTQLCMEHDALSTWCAERGGGPHHDECVERCIDCCRAIAEDFAVEQAMDGRHC